MLYRIEELQAFWQAACRPGPLLIVGGGRWGRVWAGVAADARGSSQGIVILSRNHRVDIARWCASTPDLAAIVSCQDMAGVLDAVGQPGIAIIASRPRDHVRDALETLDAGANTLVEKPLSGDVEAARELVQSARKQQRILGIGTEFAYLPVLHHLAQKLQGEASTIGNIRIHWSDPAQEVRHGTQKREHTEISILEDLLPHMISILHVFLLSGSLEITAASEKPGMGEMRLSDGTGRVISCSCSKQAESRERRLEIDVNGATIEVDFASAQPVITDKGQHSPVPQAFLALRSTLRLELGAFNMVAEDPQMASPLTSNIAPLLELQDQLLVKRQEIRP